jgi:hypothetical protein
MPIIPSFTPTPHGSPITEFALSITSLRDDDEFAQGTAVLVGPNLALTARHVVDDYWQRYEGTTLKSGPGAGSFSLQAMQMCGPRNDLAIWNITKYWVTGEGGPDMAVLQLTPTSAIAAKYSSHGVTMNLIPPAIGTRISCFGYTDTLVEPGVVDGEPGSIFRRAGHTSTGEILDVYPQRRDRATMPYPSLHTNARFDGSMSGGPVFNESGEMCGLICSSYPPSSTDEPHASFVALLWTLMTIPVSVARTDDRASSMYPFWELARDGVVQARNWDRVTVTPSPTIPGNYDGALRLRPAEYSRIQAK